MQSRDAEDVVPYKSHRIRCFATNIMLSVIVCFLGQSRTPVPTNAHKQSINCSYRLLMNIKKDTIPERTHHAQRNSYMCWKP